MLTGAAAKRRRTEKKAEPAEADADVDVSGPWTLQNRQPWADKEVEPARPTAEQLEWLEREGFIKEPEEGAEAGTQGGRVRVGPCLGCLNPKTLYQYRQERQGPHQGLKAGG